MREKVKNSTVIDHHRLNTVRDCDVIIVLREGQVAELDTLKDSWVVRGDFLQHDCFSKFIPLISFQNYG